MASTPPPPAPLPSSSSTTTNPLGLLGSGFDALSGFLTAIANVVQPLEDQIAADVVVDVWTPLQKVLGYVEHLTPIVGGDMKKIWDFAANLTFGSIYRLMLDVGLGLDTTTADDQATKGITTVDTMITFAFLMAMAAGALEVPAKGLLGGRFGTGLIDAIKELPQEMGMSWAMGLQIDKAFEAAVGRSIEEWIYKSKRPNAPEWPLIRTMLRQHIVTPAQLDERFKAAGIPDNWITHLLDLADQRLAVGDLSNAFQHDILTADQVENYLKQLGFQEKSKVSGMPSDVEILRTLYVDKAETEASRVYVSTARGLFRSQLIDEKTYRTILENLNYPAKQIQDDVAAVLLEQGTGRIANTATAIKSALLHHSIDQPTAVLRLQQLGYSANAATELTNAWLAPAIHPVHGLSQSLILSYLISGYLTPETARPKLLATGIDAGDADFLIAHPTARPGVRVRPLTPAFVTQAYVDGIVDETQLSDLYTRAGVAAAQLNQQIAMAKYKLAHKRGGTNGTRLLSEGQIVDAWSFGLLDQPTAVGALVAQGYGSPDATLLLEIKNKGPIVDPGPALFSSVAAAISYLESLGYHILPPPDPHLNTALSMVQSAGYTIEPPQ